MKNIALCFDCVRGLGGTGGTTNAAALADLMRSQDGQIVWSPTDAGPSRLRGPRLSKELARAAITEAYEFLVAEWTPGDRIFLLGAGRGGACAQALAQLLGAVGVLSQDVPGWTAEDFREYVLSTYVLPRTRRDDTDWEHIGQLAARLSGRTDVAVPVNFLGLWDTVALPGLPRTGALTNVLAARHAVAIDGRARRRGTPLLGDSGDAVQEVWFRGDHCDVTGGPTACPPLAGIACDWVLDGAVQAGAQLRPCPQRCAPSAVDALAGNAHTVSLRTVPAGALVHASVQSYLRAHPSYWRRLPARVQWADPDWAARSERLVPGSPPISLAPPAATENPALVGA